MKGRVFCMYEEKITMRVYQNFGRFARLLAISSSEGM